MTAIIPAAFAILFAIACSAARSCNAGRREPGLQDGYPVNYIRRPAWLVALDWTLLAGFIFSSSLATIAAGRWALLILPAWMCYLVGEFTGKWAVALLLFALALVGVGVMIG